MVSFSQLLANVFRERAIFALVIVLGSRQVLRLRAFKNSVFEAQNGEEPNFPQGFPSTSLEKLQCTDEFL